MSDLSVPAEVWERCRPEGRSRQPWTELEAILDLASDAASGKLRSQRAYAGRWHRSRMWVRKTLAQFVAQDRAKYQQMDQRVSQESVGIRMGLDPLERSAQNPAQKATQITVREDWIRAMVQGHPNREVRALEPELPAIIEGCLRWYRDHPTENLDWTIAIKKWIEREPKARAKRARQAP